MAPTQPSSQLSRQVFRRILASEPIAAHPQCLRHRRLSSSSPPRWQQQRNHDRASLPRNAYPLLIRQQRRALSQPNTKQSQQATRSLFSFPNLFHKPPRDVRAADIDPGIEVMDSYAKMERLRARLPPVEEVAKAWLAFFSHKSKKYAERRTVVIEDTQAQLALKSFRYIHKSQSSQQLLNEETLKMAGDILERSKPAIISDAHVQLAKEIGDALSSDDRLVPYISLLAVNSPSQAQAILLQQELDLRQISQLSPHQQVIDHGDELKSWYSEKVYFLEAWWTPVLSGFAAKRDETGALAALALMEERGFGRSLRVTEIMLGLYTQLSDPNAIRTWWQEYRAQTLGSADTKLSSTVVDAVLRWCLRNKELDLGQGVVHDIMQKNPPKALWDAVLVWAAGTGKGVDEIDRMMTVMERSNDHIKDRAEWRMPDIATINALVDFSIERNDPYMAERFIGLGRERNLEPDARTFVLQMEYRLHVDDIDGALAAYKNLQGQDVSSQEDVSAVNKLLVALATSKRHDFDTIMNVASDLSERGARFDPLTVSTLSVLHLSRDEMHDVIDLLNTHTFHYSGVERGEIRSTLIRYATDEATPTSRAWVTYNILRQVFDEMEREQRTRLMRSFLTRERPDMAVQVFNQMRAHTREDTIPTTSTYVSAFLGIAQLTHPDVESLEVIHNQLKLDVNIDVSTYLNNALMIAYTACNEPRRALRFWNDISASREGPTYNSIHIAFRACEKAPWGDEKAQEIWQRLQRSNVEIDQSLWSSYIAALVGNGDVALAVRTLEESLALPRGQGPIADAFLLGSLFNAAPHPSKQGEVEEWIKATCPEVWHEMENDTGIAEEEAEFDQFMPMAGIGGRKRIVKLDRSVTP